MKKMLRLLLPLSLLLLACGLGSAPTSLPTKTRLPPGPPGSPPTWLPSETLQSLDGMTRVRLERSGGNFMDQMLAELERAAQLGQTPILGFDASW